VGGSEKSRLFGAEMRKQTWRWTKLLKMLEMTTTGSHAGSQVLDEVRHRLVDVFLWSSSEMVRKTTFNSVVVGFGWSLRHFSSMAPQTR